MNSKLKYLVVDSGAYIQKQPLWNHAEELYSVPEVLEEIRDEQTRQFINSFPVKVNFCQPQPSSLKFITDFSKKSGDFHVLSVTDLKLLALTYELEVKENGSSHLRQEPLKKITNTTVTVPISQLNNSTQEDSCNDGDALEAIEEGVESEKMEEENQTIVNGESCKEDNNDDGWTTVSKRRKRKNFAPSLQENSETASITSSVREKLDAMCFDLLQILESHFTKYSYVGGYSSSPAQEMAVFLVVRWTVTHLSCVNERKENVLPLSRTYETPASWIPKIPSILDDASLIGLRSLWQELLGDLLHFPSNANEVQFLEEYPSIRRWLNHIVTHPWLRDTSVLHSYSAEVTANLPTKELVSSLLTRTEQFLMPRPTDVRKNSLLECDDDDEGWITPDNIDQMSNGWFPVEAGPDQGDDEEDEEEKPVTVACVTVDYAMQHVLKHIKLGVLGIDGRLIRNLRNFVLRCFACFTITPDMSLLFCPKCGHKTLKRVSITTNADGTQNIWISRRPLNTRGFRYNLPKPRGGQHAVLPLLTADQRFPHQWSKKAKGVNVLDPDYVAGSSPFSARDVNSRAAQHGYYPSSGSNSHPTLKYAKIWKPKRKKTVKK
ncbi:Ribonuclease PIN domain [Trinorchestia longiramus]|nr:Ribonuclease PIN domain [Trinorchestia longiramus]